MSILRGSEIIKETSGTTTIPSSGFEGDSYMTRFNYHFLWNNLKPSTGITFDTAGFYHDYALASRRRPAFHLEKIVCFVRSAARMIDVIFSKAVSCGLDRTMLSDWLLEACAKTGDETLAKQYLEDLLPSAWPFAEDDVLKKPPKKKIIPRNCRFQ